MVLTLLIQDGILQVTFLHVLLVLSLDLTLTTEIETAKVVDLSLLATKIGMAFSQFFLMFLEVGLGRVLFFLFAETDNA